MNGVFDYFILFFIPHLSMYGRGITYSYHLTGAITDAEWIPSILLKVSNSKSDLSVHVGGRCRNDIAYIARTLDGLI